MASSPDLEALPSKEWTVFWSSWIS